MSSTNSIRSGAQKTLLLSLFVFTVIDLKLCWGVRNVRYGQPLGHSVHLSLCYNNSKHLWLLSKISKTFETFRKFTTIGISHLWNSKVIFYTFYIRTTWNNSHPNNLWLLSKISKNDKSLRLSENLPKLELHIFYIHFAYVNLKTIAIQIIYGC